MAPSRIIVVIALLLAGAAVGVAGMLSSDIDQKRVELDLTYSTDTGDLSPDMVFAHAAMGSFRGIAINVLWQRAQSLKQEGNYYPAMQIEEWIGTLMPRFPKVWEYSSWNMAYNISVSQQTPRERWRWVSAGIDLLREKGIPANPESLPLYRQLGWILLHKVGEFQDRENQYYKLQIARQFDAILGEPPLGATVDEHIQWLRDSFDGPETLDAYLAGDATLASDDAEADRALRQQLWTWLTVEQDRELTLETLIDINERRLRWPDWAEQPQIDALLTLGRNRVVRERFRMDPAYMATVAEAFGPLDYRHSAPHAIYWTQLGLDRVATGDRVEEADIGAINTRRNFFMALQQLMRSGRIVFEPAVAEGAEPYFNRMPDPRFVFAYKDYYEKLVEESEDPEAREAFKEAFQYGSRNFMDLAIAQAWSLGYEDLARELYDEQRSAVVGTRFAPRYDPPLVEFVLANVRESIDTPDNARWWIVSNIQRAIEYGVMNNEPEAGARHMRLATEAWNHYRELNPNPNDPLYKEIKSMEQMVRDTTRALLLSPIDPVAKIRLWRFSSEEVKQNLWPELNGRLRFEAREAGLDPDVAYPAPEGMVPTPLPPPQAGQQAAARAN